MSKCFKIISYYKLTYLYNLSLSNSLTILPLILLQQPYYTHFKITLSNLIYDNLTSDLVTTTVPYLILLLQQYHTLSCYNNRTIPYLVTTTVAYLILL